LGIANRINILKSVASEEHPSERLQRLADLWVQYNDLPTLLETEKQLLFALS
jgi:hypothetical protein